MNMPIYTKSSYGNNLEIKVRGEIKKDMDSMRTIFPTEFKRIVPLMQCDKPLRSGVTYPCELWENIINNKEYDLPIYGEKDNPDSFIGRVENVEIRDKNIVYATIKISTSTVWGAFALNNLAENNKLYMKPYLLCKLDHNKVINPDDYILKSFYLVDYPEVLPDNVYEAYYGYHEKEDIIKLNKDEVISETDRVLNEIKEEETKSPFKVDDKIFKSDHSFSNSSLYTSEEMPTNQTLLDRFNSVTSSEDIFKNTENIL